MIIVDTNVWSELAKLAPEPRVVRWEREHAEQLWLSTIVLAEWRAGAALMPAGRNREALSALIEAVLDEYRDRVLDFDERCSRWYGIVLADARSSGKPINSADAMIAATARAHGTTLATRDLDDFAGAGITLVNPWDD
ncbi:MAG: type II toxin-antitoxin system VapC family toxin [Sphingomicrobium sp.]|nr:type II toxin-antitoxin system VapC family toxin [Sphingomonadales bacterium]